MKSKSVPHTARQRALMLSHGLAWVLVGVLSACSSMKQPQADQLVVPAPPPVVPASAPVAAVDEPVIKKPSAGDMSLADGLKAYQAGQYRMAETQLKTALQLGLSASVDVANAHKHLAFIYCTSKRDAQCLAAFKAAKAADTNFALTKAEAGHPMWAKTYKKALGLK